MYTLCIRPAEILPESVEVGRNSQAPKGSFCLTCFTCQTAYCLIFTLTVGGGLSRALRLEKCEWPLGKNKKALTALMLLEPIARCCYSLRSMTSTVVNYTSFKCSHARSLSGTHSGVFWEVFDALCLCLRYHNPVLTLWLLLGFASPPNICVKFKRGNLSDGWRLDWCVCRK